MTYTGAVEGLKLGSFTLAGPLARGGMGSVWRAVHRSGVAAAVKIIPAETAGGLDAAATLQAEIRSVGALDHPNIVRVYDAGVLEAHHELSSGGKLHAGSPWLAMELANGSVHELLRTLDWRLLVDLLLQVLDALAHAHARGVVHRDLKPANLLYVRDRAMRVLLADFGLAWRRGSDLVHGGSLPYAAPEQILGLRTEQGPWTDLYGLGCCAYRLATGSRPYKGGDPEQIKRGHLFAPVPVVRPRFPAPTGFADWLAGMMAKDPNERFQSAADAAYALVQLPEPDGGGRTEEDVVDQDSVTGRSGRSSDGTATLPVTMWAHLDREPARPQASQARAPVPPDWARPREDRASALGGRGLGLFGLRVPPMAGRTAERDRLWAMLCELERPALVVIRGAAGVGKSRLASWFVERAYEVGAAEGFRARFQRDVEDMDGLPGLVEDHLNTHGMDGAEIVRHLRHRMPSDPDGDREAYAIARLLRPDDPDLVDDPLPARERVAVAWTALARRVRGRRVIVSLDDAQHASEPLALIEHVVGLPDPPKVLFVVTLRDEPAPHRARLQALIDRLDGVEIDLGPMSERELALLVHRMLPLEGDLAAKIASNAGGSPVVAVQLVAALIERGSLTGDPAGMRLEATENLPESLAEVWTDALDHLDLPGARGALRIAAILGPTFVHAQWRDVAQRLGRPFDPALPAGLVNRGFLVPERTGGRYTFAHPLLREVLVAEVQAAGPAVDRACAESLLALGPAFAARAAAHFDAAGAPGPASDAYLAAMRWLSEWDRERALEIAIRWRAALARVASPTDPRWIAGLQVIVDLYGSTGGDAHRAAVDELIELGRATHDRGAEVRGLIELARLDIRALALERAEARAEVAVKVARGTPLQALASVTRAEVRRHRGDHRGAEATLREVLGLSSPSETTPNARIAAVFALARVLCEVRRPREALNLLADGLGPQTQALPPMTRARLLRARGAAMLDMRHVDEAVGFLEEAQVLRKRAGTDWFALDLDLGCARVAAGQLDGASAELEPLLHRFAADDALHRGQLLAALAEIAALRGQPDRCTRCVQMLEALPVRGHRRATHDAVKRIASWARANDHHALSHRARRWGDRAVSGTLPLDTSRPPE